jgi:hypothetical protein
LGILSFCSLEISLVNAFRYRKSLIFAYLITTRY